MVNTTIDRCRHLERRRARLSSADAPASPSLEAAELGRRFRDGDPDAIREIYRQFSRPLLTVARRHLSDAEQANDAVQQTFLKAWRAASSFDADRPLAPWLFQICRRVCIDEVRARRGRTDTIGDHEGDLRLSVAGPDLEQAWTVFELRRAIDELAPDIRDVVRLVHLDGWTVRQTAALLGLPIGTVKSRSFRAQKRLVSALRHLRDVAAVDGPHGR